ncbi:MAG: orotidine-5'-phosphate decarboxylase [Ignavibacteriales bacterium]|nr:orotidine-5'-phosphate decarboxylase [Ignavibacteriales bacterium]MBI3787891.1 orotidine-5'-phosphate decarboxylase [Ignavibacteriales bacterium]
MSFLTKLRNIQSKNRSLLCVGLDTDIELIPKHLLSSANPVLEFNRSIVEATGDLVCAYKLNLAFYEAMGNAGWQTLRDTLSLVPKSVITIGDGKRGDIGNTAERYAEALFDDLGFDAATVNPYMGYDSVEPFLRNDNHGAFLLALTSNEGSNDFQRLNIGGKPLYERVVQTAAKWNTKKNLGLVVGATHPDELRSIRLLAPTVPLLIPGIGKQGGDLRSAVRYGCTKRGDLAIINSSRSIIYASNGKDFAKAARKEAEKLRNQMEKLQTQLLRKS